MTHYQHMRHTNTALLPFVALTLLKNDINWPQQLATSFRGSLHLSDRRLKRCYKDPQKRIIMHFNLEAGGEAIPHSSCVMTTVASTLGPTEQTTGWWAINLLDQNEAKATVQHISEMGSGVQSTLTEHFTAIHLLKSQRLVVYFSSHYNIQSRQHTSYTTVAASIVSQFSHTW